MPDQSSAADEHAILQEITAPLATLPDDAVQIASDADFPIVFRGYDRLAVDAYVKKTSQLVAELQSTRSPEAAVRRALERVGEQITGILKRAHETAEQITTQSRREAEDRLVVARQEAAQITAAGERRIKELDADADRIWAERLRIVEDARELAAQLLAIADDAADRFPPAEEAAGQEVAQRPGAALYDAEGEVLPAEGEVLPAEGEVLPAEDEAPADQDVAPSAEDVGDDSEPTMILPPPEATQKLPRVDPGAVRPPAHPGSSEHPPVGPAEPARPDEEPPRPV